MAPRKATMGIGSISALNLGETAILSSSSDQIKKVLQSLQNSLSSGNLDTASNLFQILQKVLQNSGILNANGASSGNQLSADVSALGNALSSGDLSGAQSAFAQVLNDLKSSDSSSASSAQANATNAANVVSQSTQLIDELLAPFTTPLSSSSNQNSLLSQIYGIGGNLNVLA
jgi:hypothetical protein